MKTKEELRINGEKMEIQNTKKKAILVAKMEVNAAKQKLDKLTKYQITEEEKKKIKEEAERKERLQREEIAEAVRKRLESLPTRRAKWKTMIDDFKKKAQEKSTFPHNFITTITHELSQAVHFSINNNEPEFSFENFCKAVFIAPDED